MQQAILISSAIVAYVLLTQYGRRRFSWQRWLPAIIGIPVATAVYLSRAPAHRYDVYLYLVAAAAGSGFGALATAATGVERDPGTGRLYTRCGPAFAATWAMAMGTRVAFVWALQDVPWFAHIAGPFMRDHQIGRSAIAAAFVLMAVTMYGFRFAVIAVRARQLPGPGAAGRADTPGAPPASRQPVSGRLQTAHANEPRAGPSRPGSTFV
jgi:hypothetical protein